MNRPVIHCAELRRNVLKIL